MPMTRELRSRIGRRSKRKGSEFELRVKRTLERKLGAYVVKAGGSHGAADLVAITRNLPEYPGSRAYFVQAKSGRGPEKDELAELVAAASKCAGVPVLATRAEGGDERRHWIRLQRVVPDYGYPEAPVSIESEPKNYRLEPLWLWPLES